MDLDVTLIVQFTVLVILLLSLDRLLFKPLFGVLEARRAKIEGTRAEAVQLETLAHADEQAYVAALKDARKGVQEQREEIRRLAREEERAMLMSQRDKAGQVVVLGRESVAKAESLAREKLSEESHVLARDIVKRMLGRGV